MMLPHNIKTGKISSVSVIMMIIMVWTPKKFFLQRHMAKVLVMGLGDN
jgi:hypothetical protein